MEFTPRNDQISHWESTTGTPFAFCIDDSETLDISCPKCSSSVNVPYANDKGTGFGQFNFSAPCVQCGLTISRDSLCVAKFFRDILNPKAVLAHSLLNASGGVDIAAAEALTQVVREALGTPNVGGDKFGWKMSSIVASLQANLPHGEELLKRINHIIRAYSHPYQTAFDLGEAVLRQSRFIREMHLIKWCGNPRTFDEDEGPLLNAIVRYHHFLALDPVSMVASLDIDLVFHTHQIQGSQFSKDSVRILARLLHHDDSFEESVIVGDFNYTTKIWKATYGSNYMPATLNDCEHGCSGSLVGFVPGYYEPAEDQRIAAD